MLGEQKCDRTTVVLSSVSVLLSSALKQILCTLSAFNGQTKNLSVRD